MMAVKGALRFPRSGRPGNPVERDRRSTTPSPCPPRPPGRPVARRDDRHFPNGRRCVRTKVAVTDTPGRAMTMPLRSRGPAARSSNSCLTPRRDNSAVQSRQRLLDGQNRSHGAPRCPDEAPLLSGRHERNSSRVGARVVDGDLHVAPRWVDDRVFVRWGYVASSDIHFVVASNVSDDAPG